MRQAWLRRGCLRWGAAIRARCSTTPGEHYAHLLREDIREKMLKVMHDGTSVGQGGRRVTQKVTTRAEQQAVRPQVI